ncbi:MAG: hypothetical protein RML73_04490, partial [Anaerolineae bacterium]|nr:hypothetical protein [Anaerolineae bacterium]
MRKPYMTGSLWVSVTQAFETNDAQPYEIPLSQYQNSRARLSTADGLPPNLIARISNQRNEHQLYLLELRLGKQDLLGVPRKQLTENPSVFKDTEGNVYTLWYAPEGSYFTPETDNTIL